MKKVIIISSVIIVLLLFVFLFSYLFQRDQFGISRIEKILFVPVAEEVFKGANENNTTYKVAEQTNSEVADTNSLKIKSPLPGQIFERNDEIQINWEGANRTVILGITPVSGAKKGIIYLISKNQEPSNPLVWKDRKVCFKSDMSDCGEAPAGDYKVVIMEENPYVQAATDGFITLK